VSKQFGVMLELEIKTLGFSKKVIEQWTKIQR
jgi:hypothetical protein